MDWGIFIITTWKHLSIGYLVVLLQTVTAQIFCPPPVQAFQPSPEVSVYQVGVPPPMNLVMSGSKGQPPIPCPPSMPMPIAAPMPAVPLPGPYPPPMMFQYPPPPPPPPPPPLIRYVTDVDSSCSDSESDSSSCTTSSEISSASMENFRRSRRKNKSKRKKKFQRLSRRKLNYRRINSEDVQPVLSFVNERGNTKIRQTISENDAVDLLEESNNNYNTRLNEGYDDMDNMIQNVKLTHQESGDKKQRQLVLATEVLEDPVKVAEKISRKSSPKRLNAKKIGHQALETGQKEIIFRPPLNKQITNLSVSFQVV